MINNLQEAIKYFKGRSVSLVAGIPTARKIKVNGKKVILPLPAEELEKIANETIYEPVANVFHKEVKKLILSTTYGVFGKE